MKLFKNKETLMKIMVCYDTSEAADNALSLAQVYAKKWHAAIDVVSAIRREDPLDQASQRNIEEDFQARVKERFHAVDIPYAGHMLIKPFAIGEQLVMFSENRDYEFIKLDHLSVANDSSNSNGVTWNDFDNDGDLDLFIANGGNQPNLLYTNPGNRNNWIKIKCIGTSSNRSAIGAKVIVHSKNKRQYREVSGQTGGGYGGQNGLILHFGLGKETRIDSITVNWPSGKFSEIKKPKCNTLLTITE